MSNGAHVVVQEPAREAYTVALMASEVTFGRGSDMDVTLREKRASREHFKIIQVAGFFQALDLGSTNGLRIKGEKIRKRDLADGDCLEIGETRITYRGPTSPRSGSRVEPAKAAPKDWLPKDFDADKKLVCKRCGKGMSQWLGCDEYEDEPEEGEDLAPCAYNEMRREAAEFYADHIARNQTFLGSLGLFNRNGVIAEVLERDDLPWLVTVTCWACHFPNLFVNEFRTQCRPCHNCGKEVKLEETEVPKLG